MITVRWKKCPRCGGRYGFERHGGATKGWQREFLGRPTEACPSCGVTLATGKVMRIGDLPPERRLSLFAAIALESFAMAIWIAAVVTILGLIAAYVTGSTWIGVGVGAVLFTAGVLRLAQAQVRGYKVLR